MYLPPAISSLNGNTLSIIVAPFTKFAVIICCLGLALVIKTRNQNKKKAKTTDDHCRCLKKIKKDNVCEIFFENGLTLILDYKCKLGIHSKSVF